MATDADNPTLLQVLVLERVDRARNMARFYVLSIEPTLFEDLALVRRWGRIGSAGRERIDLHPSRPVAQIELTKWLDREEAPRIPAPSVTAGVRVAPPRGPSVRLSDLATDSLRLTPRQRFGRLGFRISTFGFSDMNSSGTNAILIPQPA